MLGIDTTRRARGAATARREHSTLHEFAKAAVAVAGLDAAVEPISRRDYPTKASRPRTLHRQAPRG